MTLIKIFLLYAVVLLLAATKAFPADDHATDGAPLDKTKTEDKDQTSRAEASTSNLDKEFDLLAKVFTSMPRKFIEDKYGKRLGDALSKVVANGEDNEDIAKLISEFVGTINDDQLDQLGKVIADELPEAKKHPEDKPYLELVKRLSWAKGIIRKEEKKDLPAEYSSFKSAFEKDHAAQQAENDKFYDLLKGARTGNEPAKKSLRENYDPKAILAFMDAQRKNGNPELAKNLGEALAFDVEGEPAIDAVSSDNKNVRIWLGKDSAAHEAALKEFGEKDKGFSELSLSPTQHEKVDVTFRPKFVSIADNNPGYTGANKTKNSNNGNNSSISSEKGGVENNNPNSAVSKTSRQGSSNNSAVKTQALAVLQNRCVGCHKAGGPGADYILLNNDGSIAENQPDGSSRADVLKSIIKAAVDGNGMPKPKKGQPRKPLSAQEKDILRQWANL